MDREAFLKAVERGKERESLNSEIGLLQEKTLHASLKYYFEPHEENHEQKVGGYVADIVGENGVIEIQTGNTTPLVRKVKAFLPVTRVTVVCPVIREKKLIWIDPETGEVSQKRKSPKSGSVFDGIAAARPLKEFFLKEGFTLCVPLIDCEEYRYLDGWSKDKKKGFSRLDYLPTALQEEHYFIGKDDYKTFFDGVLDQIPPIFTVKDFGKVTKVKGRALYSLVYILEELSLIEQLPKKGRANRYQRISEKNKQEETEDVSKEIRS